MKHTAIPLEIYSLHLSTINNIKFSKREIDIIACILSGRSAKGIAHFLSIAPKTAEVHIYNVMKKIGCNSRDNVITLIQNSDKFLIVKQYYLSLLTYVAFEESLKEIAQLIGDKHPTCFIVSDKEQNQTILLQQLKSNLDLVGLKTIAEIRKANKTQAGSKPFCFVFKNEEEKNKNNLKKLDDVQCVTLTNYYSSVFEILQSFFPEIKIQEIVKKFETQDTFTQESQPNQTQKKHVLGVEKSSELLKVPLLKYKKWGVLISSALILGGLSLSVLNYKRIKEEKRIESVARSDLILPSESVLLNRPEFLSKIEEKLTEKPGIQTVALVGMGGVGKTTLARQFARQHNASVVWEINAETDQSLQSSFEDLAFSLAQKPEDKKVLRDIQETRDAKEREIKLLSFVKERLRPLSNWLLIYDNVEKFSDIQKYFPHDPNTWGAGKVLITTRDHNIQNDSHVDYVLQIGGLDSNQKLALFGKILGKEQLTKARQEEVHQFLERIPPFPLDVSVAAYYLKATNVPYERYVGYINQNNQDFANTQEKILKEVSAYSKTRYSIITASLKNLINTHKEFADLLLLISLIDSQNIPRDLLVKYKNDILVDNFIYHLKKYSFIIKSSHNDSKSDTFSIHRSTQAISLNYLTSILELEKNRNLTSLAVHALKEYIYQESDKEDFFEKKFLVNHCEKCLSHNNLLSELGEGILSGELGHFYYYLSDQKNARKFLEKSLLILNKEEKKYNNPLAKTLSYLGIFFWGIGEFNEAQKFLEKSLRIYKNFVKKDYEGLSLSYKYLGMLYADQGKYEKAQEVYEESIKILRNHLPKKNLMLASALSNLGHVYFSLGFYKKAKKIIVESFAIYNKFFNRAHNNMSDSLATLGYFYSGIGEFEKAKNLHEEVFNLFKKNYPKDSRHMAWASRNLGTAYNELGNYQMAKKLLEQSFKTFKNLLGNDNIKTKWALACLGEAYRDMGDTKKAKDAFKECLKAYEVHYGKGHAQVALILKALGKTYLLENNLETSEEFLQKALNIYQKKNHPYVYAILEDLAEVYAKKSKQIGNKSECQFFEKKAINYLKQALQIVSTHFPEDSPHIIRIQNKLKSINEK